MAQFLLYTHVAAPLILLGTPEWMADRISGACASAASPPGSAPR